MNSREDGRQTARKPRSVEMLEEEFLDGINGAEPDAAIKMRRYLSAWTFLKWQRIAGIVFKSWGGHMGSSITVREL